MPIPRPALAARGENVYVIFRDLESTGGASFAVSERSQRTRWHAEDLGVDDVGMWKPNCGEVFWNPGGGMHIVAQLVGQGDHETLENAPPQPASALGWMP